MNRPIVVAIDYSELAELALGVGLLVGGRLGSVEVHALAVAEREGPRLPEELTADVKQEFLAETTKTLEAYVQRIAREWPNVTVVSHVTFGDPKERILELAKTVDAGLIVLGTHGRRGVQRLLLGSVAESVIRRATCPVLAVREADKPDSDARAGGAAAAGLAVAPRRIGVAVDFSTGSRRALEEAARWARLFDAELLIVHILEPAHFVSADALGHLGSVEAPIEDYTRDHAKKRLEDFWRETLGSGMLKVRAEVHEGIAGEAVLRAARDSACDWLVIGTHGRRGWRRALLGSVAEGVMREAPCPFLAVHSEAPASEL